VHDERGRLEGVTRLLTRHGFTLTTEQERAMVDTDLYLLYARR
jgi:hypothetical protein